MNLQYKFIWVIILDGCQFSVNGLYLFLDLLISLGHFFNFLFYLLMLDIKLVLFLVKIVSFLGYLLFKFSQILNLWVEQFINWIIMAAIMFRKSINEWFEAIYSDICIGHACLNNLRYVIFRWLPIKRLWFIFVFLGHSILLFFKVLNILDKFLYFFIFILSEWLGHLECLSS